MKKKKKTQIDIEPNTCRERNNGGREKELWGHQRQEGVWLSPIYSKKAHRIDQIRELRERERCWSKYYSLSLSLSFAMSGRFWPVVTVSATYPDFFSKKKRKEDTHCVRILEVSYQYLC